MFRQSWKCGVIGLVVVIALLAAVTPVSAGWGHRCCGYGGYWGYSPWYYSGWYSSCGWGCYSGCYGCYRSCYSGCSWGGGCGNSYGVTVSSCCGDGAVVAPAGSPTPAPQAPTPAKKPIIEPLTPEPAPAPGLPGPAPEPAKPSASTSAESGVLTVWVPHDAKVTVNGLETRSTGSKRQFVSYGLKPGFTYKYVVRASVVRNGQLEEEQPQTVTLTAGQITSVAFGFNTTAPQVAAR